MQDTYILYCAQEANFQTRSLLIPFDRITTKRLGDFHRIKERSEMYEGLDVVFINYVSICHRQYGVLEVDDKDKEIAKLNLVFESYACSNLTGNMSDTDMLDVPVFDDDDVGFLKSSFSNLCNGFDHIGNYKKLLGNKKIKIVDSVLVLNKHNGVYKAPLIKDIDELYKTFLN